MTESKKEGNMKRGKQITLVVYITATIFLHFANPFNGLLFSILGIGSMSLTNIYGFSIYVAMLIFGNGEAFILLALFLIILAIFLSFCLMLKLLSELRYESIHPIWGRVLASFERFFILIFYFLWINIEFFSAIKSSGFHIKYIKDIEQLRCNY